MNGQCQNNSLNQIADKFIEKYRVPGLAICVIQPDTILYGVSGVRRMGDVEKIELHSKFHLGSNTKAITATIAAKLVENEDISWTSTIINIIPELKGKIKSEYNDVTLEDLLSNRGKIQPFEDNLSKEWRNIPKSLSNSKYQKLDFAKYAMNLEPVILDENSHSYSNGGFGIAALMLEKCSGKSWNKLVEELFQPYGIGYYVGFPSQETLKGNFGHKKQLGKYRPIQPDNEFDLNEYLAPSGNLSLNILGLSLFTKFHLDGLMGKTNILKPTTYEKLHFGLADYSLGWYNGYIGNSEQRFSYHGGSLGTFSSAIIVSADREIAIILLVNSDSKETTALKNEIRKELWEKYDNTKTLIPVNHK